MYVSPCKDHPGSVLLSSRIISEAIVGIYHTSTFESEVGCVRGKLPLILNYHM